MKSLGAPALVLSEPAREPRAPAGAIAQVSGGAIKLAARLAAALGDRLRVVAFTGTRGREGVSSLVGELGLGLVSIGQGPVLLIDAHAESPTLHTRFGLPRSPGLTDLLEGTCSLDVAVHPTSVAGLSLLPAGAGEPTPVRRSVGDELPKVLVRLRERFRLVLVDCPPLVRVPEAAVLVSRADGVVAVAAAERTRRRDLADLRAVVGGLPTAPLGTVLVEGKTAADLTGDGPR